MARRCKSYAAETGIAWRYFFESRRSVVRPGELGAGSDYIFALTADQGPCESLVSHRALAAWHAAHARELDASEQYALAKMRLSRAVDELENLREESLNLLADETNVEELLAPLDLA